MGLAARLLDLASLRAGLALKIAPVVQNSLDSVAVGYRLPASLALKLPTPLLGLKFLLYPCVSAPLVELGIIVRVTFSVPLFGDSLSFFQCGAFLLEIADMLMHQPVVGG